MKKLLSIILVLAMLLGMASVGAYATDPDYYVVAGSSVKVSATVNKTFKKWVDDNDHATVASDGTLSVESTVADGTTIHVTLNGYESAEEMNKENGEVTAYDAKEVKVISGKTFTLSPETTYSDKKVALSVGTNNVTLHPVYKEGTNEINYSTYGGEIEWTSDNTGVVAVEKTTGTLDAKAAGSAKITATIKIGNYKAADIIYTVSVKGLAIKDTVTNGDNIIAYDSTSEIKDYIAKEIKSAFGDTVTTVERIDIKNTSAHTYGTLKKNSATPETISTTAVGVESSGVVFESKEGCIGDMTYDVAVVADSTQYNGTWTISVEAIDDIDDEQEATFARESFLLDIPREVETMVIVDTAAKAGDYSSTSATSDEVRYTLDSSKASVKLYVVGIDDDDLAHCGTITLTGANADFSYAGEEDVKTSVDKDDFEDLFEDIADDKEDNSKTYYTELDSVKFTLSAKQYTIYVDGTEMKSTKTTVDASDLDDVEIEPLVSKAVTVDFVLNGTQYYVSNDKKADTVSYKGRLVINAVAGDVKYSVVNGGSVYLDADDFQDFFEDAVSSSSAVLEYIVIDDSDLKTTQGVLYASKTSSIEDEKLWADDDDTTTKSPYEIADVRFVANKTIANGSKIYVPFTAYGKKGSASKTAEGYIEFTTINNPFTDVASTDYFYDSALWAVGKGITKGTNVAGTLFSPAQGCTRAQVVTFLYRAAGSPSVSSSMKAEVAKFTDVNTTKHKDFIDAIAWAKYYGITSGTSATTFAPDKTCTRAQIVTFIANYVSKVEGKSVTPLYTNQFQDVKPTTTHKAYASAIQWAVEKGITKGTNAAGTLFSPDATCTRGQVVTFLYNYFK